MICDDDLTFDSIFFSFINKLKSEKRIVGLQAYYPSPLVIGRFMLFHKSLYEDVGEFEERSHGDETEFCYRAVKKGYEVIQVPRESVTHHPHTKIKPKSEIPNLLWLLRKHPDFIFYILRLVLIKMKKSSYDKEYKT